MRQGQMIKLRAYGGEVIVRRVVSLRNGTVVVCSSEEFDRAASEGREPTVVGFRLEDVVQGKEVD